MRTLDCKNVKIDVLNGFVSARYDIDMISRTYKKAVKGKKETKEGVVALRDNFLKTLSAEELEKETYRNNSDYVAYMDRIIALNGEIETLTNQYQKDIKEAREGKKSALDSIISDNLYKLYAEGHGAKFDISPEGTLKEEVIKMLEGLGFGRVETEDGRPLKAFMDYIDPVKVARRGDAFVTMLKSGDYKELLVSLICEYIRLYGLTYQINAEGSQFVNVMYS